MNLNYGTIGFLGVIIMGSLMLSQLGMTEGMDTVIEQPVIGANDRTSRETKPLPQE